MVLSLLLMGEQALICGLSASWIWHFWGVTEIGQRRPVPVGLRDSTGETGCTWLGWALATDPCPGGWGGVHERGHPPLCQCFRRKDQIQMLCLGKEATTIYPSLLLE